MFNKEIKIRGLTLKWDEKLQVYTTESSSHLYIYDKKVGLMVISKKAAGAVINDA